jgi:hypothetical protein
VAKSRRIAIFLAIDLHCIAERLRAPYLNTNTSFFQRGPMTDFKDRQRGEEAKFAMDEETAFKLAARRNRLLGEWAADLMGLTEEETDAYKKAVVQADFEEAGDEDVIRKLLGDLTAAECDISEADIRAQLEEKTVEAKRQLMSES